MVEMVLGGDKSRAVNNTVDCKTFGARELVAAHLFFDGIRSLRPYIVPTSAA